MNVQELRTKKFALVYGQSIEGCGVTRNGSEMQHWFDKNQIHFTVYSYDERMYNRRDAHKLSFTPFTRENIDEIVAELNTYDAVVFNSYPSSKFPDEAIIDFYEKVVKGVTTVKMGFMHELNKTNIDKIPFVVGIMNQMDLIYNFSEDTWFSKTISTMLPSKTLHERVKKFTMWFNFDVLQPLRDGIKLEDKEKKLLYIGRWTTMKDPRRVLELGPMISAKDPEFKTELIGIERSIGAKCDIFDHPHTLDCTGKEPKIGPKSCVPVYGTYVREEGMQTLAKSLFGCSFYRMPKAPENYGNRMEYTQIEVIAAGSIPVFDKHWGENNRTLDGRRYIDIPYSAIYSDKENLDDTVDQLIKVANDRELQEKIRETSYKIVVDEFSCDNVLPEMFSYILEKGKDENKFKNDRDLIKHLVNPKIQDEYLALYDEYTAKGRIPVMGIKELTENIFSVLDGKKEEVIKVFKIKKEK
jgi:glycosyltransferase involved in cell wall biosynthesis